MEIPINRADTSNIRRLHGMKEGEGYTRPGLRVIRGGRCVDEFERLKASVKDILRKAESELEVERRDVYADLLLATYDKETRRRRRTVVLAVVGSVLGAVLIYTLALKWVGYI